MSSFAAFSPALSSAPSVAGPSSRAVSSRVLGALAFVLVLALGAAFAPQGGEIAPDMAWRGNAGSPQALR